MPISDTRRRVLAGLATVAALPLLPRSARAMTQAQARALIDQVMGDVQGIINSGASESRMIARFEDLFDRYGDVPIMARYALGVDGRRATPAQMRAFTQAFQGYISRKYGKRFREFIGGKIEVQSARPIKAGYEIRSTAFLRGEAPFEVTFLVSDKSGKDKFFNMYIEGVNMLLTERTEIGAMLDKRGGNIDRLIADLATAG